MSGRIVLLVTSPRLPAGLLTAQAWDLVRAHPVYAAAEGAQPAALRAAGVEVKIVEPSATVVLGETAARGVVWLAGPAGDQELTRELGLRLAAAPGLAELELVYGSWDPPGARLLDVVAVMDRLVSPGGDPWLGQFLAPGAGEGAHERLAHYLLEEAYEAYDAMRSANAGAVREELGDVLLQVILHARLAGLDAAGQTGGLDVAGQVGGLDVAGQAGGLDVAGQAGGLDAGAFDIDDVAGDLVAKLVRRNPHVFGGAEVADVDEITRNWEQIKRAEKARDSSMDGIALSQPALSLAAKVLARAGRAGRAGDVLRAVDAGNARPAAPAPSAGSSSAGSSLPRLGQAEPTTETELGARLFALVVQAAAVGLDAEAALRRTVLEAADAVRRAEAAGRDGV